VSSPTEVLNDVQSRALDRELTNREKTRVVVQVDHGSVAVGANLVASTLADTLPESAYLVVAGSDGASFEAPKILVTSPEGQGSVYTNVSPDFAGKLAGNLNMRSEHDQSFFDSQKRVALDLAGEISSTVVDDYLANNGYSGLAKALTMSPADVIEQVKLSGLRGRGGAYFPAALKWEGASKAIGTPKYFVVNAEEGEPGIFKDRHLMESVPHRILEGMIIAAYATGVERAYFYINAEANLSASRIRLAVDQAYANGFLGRNILGSGYELEVEICRGAGGYVCGEETTLLNTLEGYRREPRLRPPFPTEAGLWSKPTVINNPETLCSVPFILTNGPDEFRNIGTDQASGTKIVSLSGSVGRPGVVEVPMGTTLRDIIYDIGGGTVNGRELTGVAVGGPSSGVLPPSELSTRIAPGLLHEAGVMLGAGGVIALDERLSVLETIRSLASYNAQESCGKCTPCREGTPRIVDTLDRLIAGTGSRSDLDELRYLADVVKTASLCGLGQAAGGPITSGLKFFESEFNNLVPY